MGSPRDAGLGSDKVCHSTGLAPYVLAVGEENDRLAEHVFPTHAPNVLSGFFEQKKKLRTSSGFVSN